ncbi:hypothetical protein [Mangrovivirga cuniculi]|uniref:Uncharacterized protein n=1 Tax=Mangrovivirga cuniculi TaxID=2715131 RepID=A0A4D7JMB8_9BACT|nr:hypothetical protein [Mangrovivirga cuniculi]QCK15797.1 hypothetical protein DCC35_14105 [Mangrovivirga cuniculi]
MNIKSIVIMVLILVSQLSYGQEVKRKKKKKYSSTFSEVYYVLKRDKSVKDGPYELMFKGNTIIKGEYTDSKKTGNWQYFNLQGELLLTYDFEQDSMISWNNKKIDVVQWNQGISKNGPFVSMGGNIVSLARVAFSAKRVPYNYHLNSIIYIFDIISI